MNLRAHYDTSFTNIKNSVRVSDSEEKTTLYRYDIGLEKSDTTAMQLLINHHPYPVFIVNESSDVVMEANSAAIRGYHHLSVRGMNLRHILRHREQLDDETTLTYFDKKWQLVTKEAFDWEEQSLAMISLTEHPALPADRDILSAKDMVAVVLHRLRSPMTGMQGYLELLMNETSVDQHRKRLALLNNGLWQLKEMLNELETLHTSDRTSDPQNLYPEAIIKEILSELPSEEQNRVLVRSECLPEAVKNCRDKIRLLFKILINNATEHPSGKDREVIIHLESSHKITITNFGDPVPEFLKQRMFSPFMTDKAQHMGIGLTVALMLCRKMGISLIPTSNCAEEGISFSVLLPPEQNAVAFNGNA